MFSVETAEKLGMKRIIYIELIMFLKGMTINAVEVCGTNPNTLSIILLLGSIKHLFMLHILYFQF